MCVGVYERQRRAGKCVARVLNTKNSFLGIFMYSVSLRFFQELNNKAHLHLSLEL